MSTATSSSLSSSPSIRPVTSRWPSSSALWQETSLPLSVVLLPLGFSSHHSSSSSTATRQDDSRGSDLLLYQLENIPKCLYCGAPQQEGLVHYPVHGGTANLCYLCGHVTSRQYDDQVLARRDGNEELSSPDVFRRRGVPVSSSSSNRYSASELLLRIPLYDNVYRRPAMACPPVWWIVVDGTTTAAGQQQQQYWNTMTTCLRNVCHNIPSYVHVGLLVSQSASLAVWDLTSAVPHVKHYTWEQLSQQSSSGSNKNGGLLLQQQQQQQQPKLPLSPVITSNLQAALRALGDTASCFHTTTTKSNSTTTASSIMGTSSSGNHTKQQQGSMPLGVTIEVILDTMQRQQQQQKTATEPTYAGGKVLCILGAGGAPTPIQITSSRRQATTPTRRRGLGQHVGTGGFGGSCAPMGQRYDTKGGRSSSSTAGHSDPELGQGAVREEQQEVLERQDSDMTAANLAKIYRNTSSSSSSPSVELYYSDLGQQCARAGLGVDVLVLRPAGAVSTPTTTNDDLIDFGIPFLRQLSDRSGAPGPVLCTDADLFEREVRSRTPWNPSTVFGGKLRVRLSPGFAVDTSPVEGTDEDGPQLAPLYSSGGLMGPATSEDDDGLWTMGCCDTSTAVTIDLTVKHKSIKDRTYVDGMGECMINHAIQMCFAYTTIEQQDDGSFVTVRRMRVASTHLPLAHDTESLYATLDPEALAVVLFHKLTIASLQDGLVQTHEIGQQWLQSLMTCLYRSAEEEERLQEEQLSRGLDNMNPVFYPQERLLDRNGELSAVDVLLGLGHERVGAVPLIVFALLQCDALRPNMGRFRPSVDSRAAASAQMYSMPPSVLARCVAPRVELWPSGEDVLEPIMEDMELNLEHIGLSLMEHRQTGHDESGDLILFVDSPREILVCDSRHLQPSESTSKVVIGEGLKRSIEIAAASYREPPPILYELDPPKSASSSSVSPLSRMKDVLMEDSQTVQGLRNFVEWRQDMAGLVQEALER